MIILPFSKEHISQVAQLERECFSLPWSEKSLSEELNNPNAHFLVATENDTVTGYVGIIDICGECSITNIAVFKNYRHKGVASALLKKAIADAVNRNSIFITLEVRESNISAVNLYKKFDFEVVGRRKNFYSRPTEDAILMTKELEVK